MGWILPARVSFIASLLEVDGASAEQLQLAQCISSSVHAHRTSNSNLISQIVQVQSAYTQIWTSRPAAGIKAWIGDTGGIGAAMAGRKTLSVLL